MAPPGRPDDRTVEAVVALAGSSWARADLDDAWVAAGWPLPDGRSVAAEVFDSAEYRFDVDDHRWACVAMRFDPDEVAGFFLTFATFLDEDVPEDDLDVRDLVSSGGRPRSVDASAARDACDARHHEAVARRT
ncbi:hypothetical protein AB0G02_38320, partial [Actinosynnema sp. NPDC023658]|uniref:hypothetical protein n=1 Tax=Actinosynnema sp. NPDC023658 TaxID=3155465 RepID=UPI0033C4F4C1